MASTGDVWTIKPRARIYRCIAGEAGEKSVQLNDLQG